MILINMQYFGGNGAASGKSGGAGKAGGGAAAKAEAQKEELQLEYDTLASDGKIQMLKEHEEAGEVSEALWEHAIENSQRVDINSESSKGYYVKEFKEYVNTRTDKLLASQSDAVRNNTGSFSVIAKGSKGNAYIVTYDTKGDEIRKKLSKLNKY